MTEYFVQSHCASDAEKLFILKAFLSRKTQTMSKCIVMSLSSELYDIFIVFLFVWIIEMFEGSDELPKLR